MSNEISINLWTKIWFTLQPSSFITELNKARLLHFLETHPNAEVLFLYDSTLLNEEGTIDFNNFQTVLSTQYLRDKVNFMDINDAIFIEQLSQTDQRLFDLAKKELQHIGRGGNPAAASDIIRLLPPCYRRIYTDFDVYVEPFKAQYDTPTIQLKHGFYHTRNDVVIIIDDKNETLQMIKIKILNTYQCHVETIEKSIHNASSSSSLDDHTQLWKRLKEQLQHFIQRRNQAFFEEKMLHFMQPRSQTFFAENNTTIPPEEKLFIIRKCMTQILQIEIKKEEVKNQFFIDDIRRQLLWTVTKVTGPELYPSPAEEQQSNPENESFFDVSFFSRIHPQSCGYAPAPTYEIHRMYCCMNDLSWMPSEGAPRDHAKLHQPGYLTR